MLVLVALALTTLLSAASDSASGKPLVCTNVTSGYLAYKVVSYVHNTMEAILSSPARDANGHPYLYADHTAPLQLFTLQTCNSTFLGFSPNDTTAVYGRWASKGSCITTQKSDGALVLKPCATTDGSALLRQYFSMSAGTTQLVGGTAQNNTLMYTYVVRHQGINVPTPAKPPGWTFQRPNYRRYLVYCAFPSKPPVR